MVRITRFFSLFCSFLSVSSAAAQGFQTVFPGFSGPELIDSVARNYRPSVVFDYANARDTLYAKILAKDDDSLRCIYSGHTLYLDPTQDPTQYIFQNGGTNGMNTEHSYPQGKGATAGTNAHSDMHHLYPTRIALNDARGDKPFAEIPDAQTQKWFLNNQVFTSIPTQNIDAYAESGSAIFEPREASKGDIARSILYFYTVYRGQANAADPNFFDLQRATLCQWNALDPVDAAELKKTWRIAAYQEGKANPFVLDCTLATRSWCPEVMPNCQVSTNEIAQASLGLRVVPQPFSTEAKVFMELPFSGELKGRVISLLGQELSAFEMHNLQGGSLVLPINAADLVKSGGNVFFLEINLVGSEGRARQIVPLIMGR